MSSDVVIGSTSKRHSGRGRDDRRSMGEEILRRRTRGERMYEIVADLKISEDTANRYMKIALDARIPPTVDEYRRVQNDTLDQRETMLRQQIDALDAMLTTPDVPMSLAASLLAERRQTVATLLRLDERRAKLNGTDAPVRSDVTVTVQDGEDAELAEMIAEQRAAAAAREATKTDAVQ